MNNLIKHNKKVYRDIHLKFKEDTIKRVSSAIKLSDIENTKLKKKIIAIDICCGALGLGAINLIKLGIKDIHLFDSNKKNVLSSKKNIEKKFKDKNIKITTQYGNLENFKFKKNYFDILLCQGALHHIEKDTKSLKNIYQSAKKNSIFLLTVQGKGGLITDITYDVLSKNYHKDKKTKLFFDSLFDKNSKLEKYINFLMKNTNKEGSKFLRLVLKLADDDFMQTLEDRIKSKRYYQYTFNEIKGKLTKVGFKKIKKIKKLSPFKYKSLRQIFNSVYMHKNTFLSHILFGKDSSHINIRCYK